MHAGPSSLFLSASMVKRHGGWGHQGKGFKRWFPLLTSKENLAFLFLVVHVGVNKCSFYKSHTSTASTGSIRITNVLVTKPSSLGAEPLGQHEPWHVASQTDCLSGEEGGESACNLPAARATRGDKSCSGSGWCWLRRAALPHCNGSTLSTGSSFCQGFPGGLPKTHSCPAFTHPPLQSQGTVQAQEKVLIEGYLKVAACLPFGWNPSHNSSLTFSSSAPTCSEATLSAQQHL